MAEYTIPKPYRDFYVTNPMVNALNEINQLDNQLNDTQEDMTVLESNLQTHTHTHDRINRGINAYSAGTLSFLDQLFISDYTASKTAFLPASSISVEYTTDNGTTWTDYGLTDSQKESLFSFNKMRWVYLGGPGANQAIGNGLRITIHVTDRYASINSFYNFFLTNGATCVCTIERAKEETPESFEKIRSNVPQGGWSGPNMIHFDSTLIGGSSSTSFTYYRFTFMTTNTHDTNTNTPRVIDLRMFGQTVYNAPSNNYMVNTGHLYSWDESQNMILPSNLIIPSSTENSTKKFKLTVDDSGSITATQV